MKPHRIGLSLTRQLLITVNVVYTILLLGLLISLVFFLRDFSHSTESNSIPLWIVLIGSFISAGLGSGIYYIRKLYKMCINGDLSISKSIGSTELGTALYFLTRPLFSCAFAFLAVISLKIENQFVSPTGAILGTNFMYICLFIAFLSGFSAGKVITILEQRGAPFK